MNTALIGHSGYVGSTLLRQSSFDSLYRSTNIADAEGRHFDRIVCAGAPAQKWVANQNPEADRARIQSLIGHLSRVSCEEFILISTVDVFRHPIGVVESSPIEESGLHAYGLHRLHLEKFVAGRFAKFLIVRLPGLVGPGLRKNVVFDLLNDNNLASIDSRGSFQFYPMVNLWIDIQVALDAGLDLVHLTAEPIAVDEVSSKGFGRAFVNELPAAPARYDMRTQYADVFGSRSGSYQYAKRESLLAIRAYAQSEALTPRE